MTEFEQALWGYRLSYPEDWVHRSFPEAEGFAANRQGLEPDADGPGSGHLLIQAEWNGMRVPVEPLWEAHIARVAAMVGAHRVGSAAWGMGGAVGYEAEIVMPKKTENRLWAGFLARDWLVLKIMVAHPIEDRPWFEPIVTECLKSLSFPNHTDGVIVHESGAPLPSSCRPIDPSEALADLSDPGTWKVFETPHPFTGLHAFYAREAPAHGWQLEAFESFPGTNDPGFSRARLRKDQVVVGLGLLAYRPEAGAPTWLGRIALKIR